MLSPQDSQMPDWLRKLDIPAALHSDGVQVWRADLGESRCSSAGSKRLLSLDELERAERFATESLKQCFIASHAALRMVLSHCTGVESAELRFRSFAKGKPSLVINLPGSSPPRFSLSHSHDIALVAVARDRAVGVDVEFVSDRSNAADAAQSFLAANEQALLRQGSADRLAIFYRLWTRKEAVLKASGEGIALGLQAPDLSIGLLDPTPPAGLPVALQRAVWLVHDLHPAPGYAGAIAIGPPTAPK